jgi:ubiquinone/menaquinone biosynthesis C-methylase UbiE
MTVSKLIRKNHAIPISKPMEELPLTDQNVDLCVCINVLDHVRDADLCFKQMRRVLKKDGILVLEIQPRTGISE